MTVAANDAMSILLGNGVLKTFTFDFPCDGETSDVTVYVDLVAVTPASVDYGAQTVTLGTAPANGVYVVIVRTTSPLVQLVDYSRANNSLKLEALEDQLDLIVERLQEVARDSGRSVKAGWSATGPLIEIGATGTLLRFTSDGNIEGAGTVDSIVGQATSAAIASVLGASPVVVASRAAAVALAETLTTAPAFFDVKGYSAAGDGGGALYARQASAPSHSGYFSADVAGTTWYYVIAEEDVTPAMLGGDPTGTNDATTAVLAAGTMQNVRGGGKVIGAPGHVYRCVITTSTPNDGIAVPENVIFEGLTLELECTGSVYGLRPMSNSAVLGCTVSTTVSSSPGSSAPWHAPIFVGAAYGEVTDVDAVGDFINAEGWRIEDNIVSTVRSGGTMIGGIGGINKGSIRRNTLLANSGSAVGIGLDWGTVGNVNAADIAATRTLYNAGDCYTVHPHDIWVEGNRIEALTSTAGTHAVRLSGCYDIRVIDNTADRVVGPSVGSVANAAFFHTAGDLGAEFALDNDTRRKICRGNVFRGNVSRDSGTAWSYYADSYADNIAAAVSGEAYSPIWDVQLGVNLILENNEGWGDGLAGAVSSGIFVRNITGVSIRGNTIQFHQIGIEVGSGARAIEVTAKNKCNSNREDGIKVFGGTVPYSVTIMDNECASNGVDATVTTASGINVANGDLIYVARNTLGGIGESFQDRGLTVGEGVTRATIVDNYVLAVASSGTAYVIGTSLAYNVLSEYRNNRAHADISTKFSGVNIIPVSSDTGIGPRRFRAPKSVLTTDTTPNAAFPGVVGDIIIFTDGAAGGKSGSYCVTAGSPGTWKQFAAIDA